MHKTKALPLSKMLLHFIVLSLFCNVALSDESTEAQKLYEKALASQDILSELVSKESLTTSSFRQKQKVAKKERVILHELIKEHKSSEYLPYAVLRFLTLNREEGVPIYWGIKNDVKNIINDRNNKHRNTMLVLIKKLQTNKSSRFDGASLLYTLPSVNMLSNNKTTLTAGSKKPHQNLNEDIQERVKKESLRVRRDTPTQQVVSAKLISVDNPYVQFSKNPNIFISGLNWNSTTKSLINRKANFEYIEVFNEIKKFEKRQGSSSKEIQKLVLRVDVKAENIMAFVKEKRLGERLVNHLVYKLHTDDNAIFYREADVEYRLVDSRNKKFTTISFSRVLRKEWTTSLQTDEFLHLIKISEFGKKPDYVSNFGFSLNLYLAKLEGMDRFMQLAQSQAEDIADYPYISFNDSIYGKRVLLKKSDPRLLEVKYGWEVKMLKKNQTPRSHRHITKRDAIPPAKTITFPFSEVNDVQELNSMSLQLLGMMKNAYKESERMRRQDIANLNKQDVLDNLLYPTHERIMLGWVDVLSSIPISLEGISFALNLWALKEQFSLHQADYYKSWYSLLHENTYVSKYALCEGSEKDLTFTLTQQRLCRMAFDHDAFWQAWRVSFLQRADTTIKEIIRKNGAEMSREFIEFAFFDQFYLKNTSIEQAFEKPSVRNCFTENCDSQTRKEIAKQIQHRELTDEEIKNQITTLNDKTSELYKRINAEGVNRSFQYDVKQFIQINAAYYLTSLIDKVVSRLESIPTTDLNAYTEWESSFAQPLRINLDKLNELWDTVFSVDPKQNVAANLGLIGYSDDREISPLYGLGGSLLNSQVIWLKRAGYTPIAQFKLAPKKPDEITNQSLERKSESSDEFGMQLFTVGELAAASVGSSIGNALNSSVRAGSSHSADLQRLSMQIKRARSDFVACKNKCKNAYQVRYRLSSLLMIKDLHFLKSGGVSVSLMDEAERRLNILSELTSGFSGVSNVDGGIRTRCLSQFNSWSYAYSQTTEQRSSDDFKQTLNAYSNLFAGNLLGFKEKIEVQISALSAALKETEAELFKYKLCRDQWEYDNAI